MNELEKSKLIKEAHKPVFHSQLYNSIHDEVIEKRHNDKERLNRIKERQQIWEETKRVAKFMDTK